MGRGGYHGAHTKIWLSEDGTVWGADDERAPANSDATSGDSARSSDRARIDDSYLAPADAARIRRHKKECENKLLINYARSYLTKKPVKEVRGVPWHFIEEIKWHGSYAEWINSSPNRLDKFWQIVKQQEYLLERSTQRRPIKAAQNR